MFCEDRTRSSESLLSVADTTFDLLLLRCGIHGDASNEADVMIDFFDFVVVDGGGFLYVFFGELVSLACVSSETHNLQVVFLFVFSTERRLWFQAFLAATVETGNKNRDDFHCMQMRLVMSMCYIFGHD